MATKEELHALVGRSAAESLDEVAAILRQYAELPAGHEPPYPRSLGFIGLHHRGPRRSRSERR